MDRGDGFWTSGNKGWKTRREQQDAYRKALDDQIQQRKKLEEQRRDRHKGKAPESPKIADPVKHLMPWLSSEENQQHQVHLSEPQAQTYQVLPPPPQGPPNNYYYVANPTLPPLGAAGSGSGESLVGQGQAVQPSYGFYGQMPIPPPPPPYIAPGNGPVQVSGYPVQMVGHGQPQQMFVVPPGYGSPNPGVPQTTPAMASSAPVPVPPVPAEVKEREAEDKRAAEQEKGHEELHQQQTDGQRRIPKIHVSQTFEELNPQQSLGQYRQELAKQIEDKKRQEEERQKREREEDEKIQRRIREEQEQLKQEYEDDLKRKALKEEEDKRRQQEQLRTLELARKKLEEQAMINRQRHLKEQATRNSHAAQSSSPGRYYHRDGSWSWESRPIPVVERLCKNGELPVRDDNDDKEEKDKVGSARSNGTASASQYQSACDANNNVQSRPDSQPNSASSSKTYCISEHGERDIEVEREQVTVTPRANNQVTPSGKSKSAEEVGKGQSYLPLPGHGHDVIMCPKCSKSFSSSDVQFPKSEIERQQFLNCLENIQRRLREDKERLVRGGFQWKR